MPLIRAALGPVPLIRALDQVPLIRAQGLVPLIRAALGLVPLIRALDQVPLIRAQGPVPLIRAARAQAPWAARATQPARRLAALSLRTVFPVLYTMFRLVGSI